MGTADDSGAGHAQLPVPPAVEGDVEVPQPRTPDDEGSAPDSASVLRGLGLDALVEMLETSGYGVCVTGDDHRWVYVNPSGSRLLGRPFAELQGEDYLLSFPEHERSYLLALEHDQRAGDTGFYANTVVRPDGTEVGITWSGSVLHADGQELAPAIFHPTFGLAGAAHEAAVLGEAAARISAGGAVREVLSGLAGDAVARSRALASLVLVECAHGDLELLGGSGLPDGLQEAVRRAGLRLPDLPGGELLRAGRLMLLSDGRARLAADPLTAPVAELTAHLGWGGSVAVPLHRGGVVVGCLLLLLPASLTAPTKAELTAWSALGAHASVALADERLREQAAAYAAELERHRLGRDLHDSVIAALFSLTTRAQAVRRGLDAGDLAVVRSAAQDLEELARQAVAELRAMVTDMRGRESSSSAAELPAALRELTRSCNERDGLRVELRTEPVPGLAVGTAEHLVRIAGEALHNCVKHSGAREAQVSLEVRGSECVLTVSDDGRGFDPATAAGGHGLRIMQERALLCGGALQVDSDEGSGTRVVAHIPLPG